MMTRKYGRRKDWPAGIMSSGGMDVGGRAGGGCILFSGKETDSPAAAPPPRICGQLTHLCLLCTSTKLTLPGGGKRGKGIMRAALVEDEMEWKMSKAKQTCKDGWLDREEWMAGWSQCPPTDYGLHPIVAR